MYHNEVLKCLDKLIADFGGSSKRSGGPRDLLLEHLHAARRYLLGSMPGEYGCSLRHALESLANIPDKSERGETKKILHALMEPEAAKQGAPVAGSAGHPLLTPAL